MMVVVVVVGGGGGSCCLTSQQDAGVSQGRRKTVWGVKIAVVVAGGDLLHVPARCWRISGTEEDSMR